MSERLLTSIIELEKALQAQVAGEAARAAAWQERELALLGGDIAAAREQLRTIETEQVAAARRAADADAAQLQRETMAWCQRLAGLPDAVLERLLLRQLPLLMPEADDDHPHGQG